MEPGSPLAVAGLFPLSSPFSFSFPERELRPPPPPLPAQTRADKGDPEQSACSQVSRLGGYIAHWQRKRAMRLRSSGACACVDLRWDSGCFWWIREDWVFDSALFRKGVGTAGGGFGFERSGQWKIERENNWWIKGVLVLANGGCGYHLLAIASLS
jgi:hypothetical protein